MRWILIFIISIIANNARAQLERYNSEAFWRRLSLDTKLLTTEPDTAIVVATNRGMNKGDLRFMLECDSKDLHYFYVYAFDNQWHVLPAASLEQAIGYMPNKNNDWIIYVEGMGKLFTSGLERGMVVNGQYDVNVLLLDYPSITTTKKRLGNYYFALNKAKNCYRDFMPVLDTVKMLRSQKKLGSGHLTLFMHSMGNNMLREIVRNDRLQQLNDRVWVDNIILNAPCVPQKEHAEWLDEVQFGDRVYVNYNPRDYTLGGATLLSLKNQLGMKIKKPISRQVTYINFGKLVDRGHSNFISLPNRPPAPPEAIEHYTQLLHGHIIRFAKSNRYAPSEFRAIGWDILPSKQQESLETTVKKN